MRKVTLLFAMIAFASFAFAQKGFVPQKYNFEKAQPGTSVYSDVNATKAPGDIIFSEDFDGADWSGTSNNGEPVHDAAPAGWAIGDLSGNGFYFRWDTIGPRGIFTGGATCVDPADPMVSTTGANGYMMLEADWFNSAADCSEYFSDGMDSYIEYNAGIDFSAETAIHLIFEQNARYCCGYSSTADSWFRVSTDNGATWTGLSVHESDINVAAGALGTASFVSEFDISPDVAGEASVWFRFHMNGLSHYHWEIDDVAFVVPEDNDIQFLDYWNDYIDYRDGTEDYPLAVREDFTEGYYEYPWFMAQEFKGFHAAFINFGGQDQTNFVHNVEIYKDDAMVTSFASDAMATVTVGYQDTTMIMADYMPVANNHVDEFGVYKFVHYPSTDNLDDIPGNDTLMRYMKIGENLLRVIDFEKTNARMAPDNWTSYDEDGDGLGFEFNLPSPDLHDVDGLASFYEVDGLHVYIDRNTGDAQELALFENEEAKAVAGLYKYDSDADTYTEQISSAEVTFTVNDTMSVVFIEFAKDGTSEYIFEGGTFLVALNMYGTWVDNFGRLQSWNIRNANNSVQKRSRESGLTVNASIATGGDVGWVAEGPGFALQIQYTDEPNGVGIFDETADNLDFSVYPNPTNGTFHIDAQGNSQVTIMNAAGQVVESIVVNGSTPINLDVVSGVYFVQVQNGNKVGTQRLIVE